MALLLLGPEAAMVVAVAGAWLQCTFRVKRPYPAYRTVFSMAAEAITMGATGIAYVWLGGVLAPFEFAQLARPLVATIATYFVVNTGLIAGAIASTSERSWWKVWRDDFLWSGASFMVAGTAGAAAAVVIARREHWKAALMLAPVYLTYRTYQVFVGRLEDQKRHTAETQRLHKETIEALMLARHAEHALAQEKERLASTVAELTRLEEMRKQLLQRERSARASAEEANRLKDQFLAMVSHELRTPLNAILGWADMLRSGRLETDGRERASESIYGNAKRQARLIDELLDVARIMSGKLRLERTAVDLEEVVRGAIDVVQPAADAKGVSIKIEADVGARQHLRRSARGCSRSPGTCSRTPSSSRPRAARCSFACAAATTPRKWWSPTPATASPRSSCRGSSSRSARRTRRRRGRTAVSDSGCRSSSTSSRRTAAALALKAAARDAAPRLPSGCRSSRCPRTRPPVVGTELSVQGPSKAVAARHLGAGRRRRYGDPGGGGGAASKVVRPWSGPPPRRRRRSRSCSVSTSTCCSRISPCRAKTATR